MFLDVDAEPFGVISDTEGDSALAQDDRDHHRAGGGEAVGHQNGLQLTKDQGNSAVLGQDGSGWMGGNQRSTGEDAGQQGAHGAANAMDGEGVEGVVKTQSHLELDRGVAEHRSDRADRHGRSWGDETGAGGDANQAGGGGDVGCGEGQFRPVDGQLAAAVEAEPAKPEQPGSQDDLGHVMGRPPGLGPAFAGAHQAGQHHS